MASGDGERMGEGEGGLGRRRGRRWRRVGQTAAWGAGAGLVWGLCAASYRGLDHSFQAAYPILRSGGRRVTMLRAGPLQYVGLCSLSAGLMAGAWGVTREAVLSLPFTRKTRPPLPLARALGAGEEGPLAAHSSRSELLYWRVLDEALEGHWRGGGADAADAEVPGDGPLEGEQAMLTVDVFAGVTTGLLAGVAMGVAAPFCAAVGGVAAATASFAQRFFKRRKDQLFLQRIVDCRLRELEANGDLTKEESFEVAMALQKRMGMWGPGLHEAGDKIADVYRVVRRSFPVMRHVGDEEVAGFREDSHRRADFELWKKQRLYEEQQAKLRRSQEQEQPPQ